MPAKKQPRRKPVHKPEEIIDGETGAIVPVSDREAPQERRIEIRDIINPVFSTAQMRILTGNTPRWAIKQREGANGKMLSYVPHGYTTDQLNKAFGFNWDVIIDEIEQGRKFSLQVETIEVKDKRGEVIGTRTRRHIAIVGHITVRIRDTHNEGEWIVITKDGFGSQEWLPTMEFGDALKAARSDLVKTCSVQLGIALDLYFNEMAEYQKWEKAEVLKNASKAAAEKFANTDPSSPAILLSRSMIDYNIDGIVLSEILGEPLDTIMMLDAEGCREAWQEVKHYAETHSTEH